MTRFTALAAALALAACAPPSKPGPAEVAVTAIYDTLVKSKGAEATPLAAIPMTGDLKALVASAEAAGASRGEPVLDGDLAGNCQDCAGFTALKIAPAPAEEVAKVKAMHTAIAAAFKIGDGTAARGRAVYWDMVEEGGAWRADNISAEGFDLRAVAQTAIDEARAAASKAEGDAAVECSTYLLLQQAVAPKDAKKLDAAIAAWRKKAATYFTADELAQYLASSQAVLDDTPPKELAELAQLCLDKTPAQ